jgi:hypothetical protein
MSTVFGFETDFAGTLKCIPMAVRFKLDCCGVKLSLRQWNRFLIEERTVLLHMPCDLPTDVLSYRSTLISLIKERAQENAEEALIDPNPAWNDSTNVPLRIQQHALGLQLPPPSNARWSTLTALQRFALFKLTRPGHDNDNFLPAMREFGL